MDDGAAVQEDPSVHGFDPETLLQLREVFDFLDRDKSGAVTLDEIGYLMELLKLDSSEDALRDVIAEVDTDRDGLVCFAEFLKVIGGGRKLAYANKDVQRAFRMFADPHAPRGHISKAALKSALTTYCRQVELEGMDVDRLIAQFSHSLEDWVEYRRRIDVHISK